MKTTRSSHEPPAPPPRAAGLHVSKTRKDYFFDRIGKGKNVALYILIGRSSQCHIQVDDRSVSAVHATVERKGASMWFEDESSNGATYIDGRKVDTPVELIVGMTIQVGNTKMVVMDERGAFPVHHAYTISEVCREGSIRYGSNRLAAEHLGRSHKFIGRQFIPRNKRYKNSKKDES